MLALALPSYKSDLNLDALTNILDITYLVDLIVTGFPSAFE